MKEEEMTGKKFEEAMKELEEINNRLEREKVSLEETLELYERGMKLIQHCTDKLEEADAEIKKIIKKQGEEVRCDIEG